MKKTTLRSIVEITLCVAALVLFFAGNTIQLVGVPLILLSGIVAAFIGLFRPAKKSASTPTAINTPNTVLHGQIGREATDSTEFSISMLGVEYRKQQWQMAEQIVDGIVDTCIELIKAKIDVHTVAVLFPTADNGYKIRRFYSKSPYINKEAVIYPGVGVIGSFLKEGLKQLHLQEIVSDSMTLYYYTRDAGIRSLMASPIIAEGVERGFIIVDSTERCHFSEDNHEFLKSMAFLLAQSVYFTYRGYEHKIAHHRLSATSEVEKEFFKNLEMDALLDKLIEIIPFAISCDRITLSVKIPELPKAVIRRVWGKPVNGLLNATFSLTDKTLMGLLYSKNIPFFRNFSREHYEVRYFENEPKDNELASFIAFPIGVNECRGALLLESKQKDAFVTSSRELLMSITTSAGIALEKINNIEQAQNLATHDGLTGLINHRHFQKVLNDYITRAIRYSEPLSLVLCDIDFFKKINDTWGHPFGDTILKAIASRLMENIRQGIDVAARYGGEEFSLILAKTDATQALDTVERLRQNIANSVFKTPDGKDIHVTMSFGIAIYKEHAKTVDVLIQKADKALYRAKANGRNRVELF